MPRSNYPNGDCTPYSNPLAPQWMYPDWGHHQYCESEFLYRFPLSSAPFTIPTTGLLNQQLQFSFDSEFHITTWYVYAVDPSEQAQVDTDIYVRLSDTFGKRRISAFVSVVQAGGAVPADWVISPGGTPRLDFQNTSGAPIDVYVVFRGFKRFQNQGCPALPPDFHPVNYQPLWARYSMPPAGYVDEPYVFEFSAFSITAPFTGMQEGIPFPLDTDAPYYLRGVEFNSVNSDVTTRIGARLVTPQGNRLVLNANPTSIANPYAIETNFAGTSFVPALSRAIYPEIVCPAGGVIALDVNVVCTAGTAVGTLRLNGVKRHRAEQS